MCWFQLVECVHSSFMTVTEASLGLGLLVGQKKHMEDVTVGSVKCAVMSICHIF